jgi:hypothetical protein
MDLEEILCEIVDWINLTQNIDQCNALVNVVMDMFVP